MARAMVTDHEMPIERIRATCELAGVREKLDKAMLEL